MTDPDVNHVKGALRRAEFVALEEIFPSETSKFADVLLPGAAFAEKSGTFTNTERRVQPIRPAVHPPGEALPDWLIVSRVAQAMLAREGCTALGPWAAWDYDSPEDILREVSAVTPSYGGITWQRVDRGDRLQWPVPASDQPGTPILHTDTFPIGRGRFHVVHHTPAREQPDAQFPMVLTTGRVLYHWHGGELTRRTSGLPQLYPEPMVEVSPEDAARYGLRDAERIRLRSRRGTMIARLACTDRVAPGVVFGNFHFPEEGNVNNLTIAALDPVAKIPEYKVCAVALEPADEDR
jgi:formate dehydrogenase major subunit/formate dehydrogenase alpha subunit